MARAVGDVLDRRPVLAGELEDALDDLDVGALVGAADVVDLAGCAVGEHVRDPAPKSSTNSQLRTFSPSP